MSDIPPSATIVRRTDVVANELSASEVVMLDLERGAYFGLKDVGKAIWDALSEPTTTEALCERLMESFEVDESTCRHEVTAFLGQLRDRELIDVLGDDQTP